MEIGTFNTLTITQQQDHAFYLSDGTTEIVMAKLFAENDWQVGQEVSVFVYQDGEEIKATVEKPFAQVGEFAVMRCVETLPAGAFMDWGIIKDLFVPYREQRGKMQEGRDYLIYVYRDLETGLVTGTAKPKNSLTSANENEYQPNEKVDLIIVNPTDLGWNVIINQKHWGLVYSSEIYQDLKPLTEQSGYIKTIRPDGKIDVSLQPLGYEHNSDEFQQKILDALEKGYGILYLSDESSPEDIREELQMSKKNFKKAIGALYKARKIEIRPDSIRLL